MKGDSIKEAGVGNSGHVGGISGYNAHHIGLEKSL